eukprot:COSAG01_NODE_58778_length_304_cov_0.507317_1_plen_23_part_10
MSGTGELEADERRLLIAAVLARQ